MEHDTGAFGAFSPRLRTVTGCLKHGSVTGCDLSPSFKALRFNWHPFGRCWYIDRVISISYYLYAFIYYTNCHWENTSHKDPSAPVTLFSQRCSDACWGCVSFQYAACAAFGQAWLIEAVERSDGHFLLFTTRTLKKSKRSCDTVIVFWE